MIWRLESWWEISGDVSTGGGWTWYPGLQDSKTLIKIIMKNLIIILLLLSKLRPRQRYWKSQPSKSVSIVASLLPDSLYQILPCWLPAVQSHVSSNSYRTTRTTQNARYLVFLSYGPADCAVHGSVLWKSPRKLPVCIPRPTRFK